MSLVGADVGARGVFSADGDGWRFAGGLTFDDATAVIAATRRLELPANGVVDMSGLTHVDSAALAVLFALQRRAAGEGKALRFAALPTALCELTKVYGIEDLIAS